MPLAMDNNHTLMNAPARSPENFWPAFLLAVLTGAAILLLRTPGADFVQNSLWAEDGSIFIRQALSDGPASILMPYNGYIHLYPRLVTLLAVQFPLHALPLVMLSGWVLAWLSMTGMMVWFARSMGLGLATCVFAVAAATAQPHSGETLFNLTNSQWFMAIALTLYLASPLTGNTTSPGKYLLLLLASLTGPFAILLLPMLALRLYLLKDWRSNKGLYIAIALCAVLQACFIATTPRLGSYGLLNIGLLDWGKTLVNALTFGHRRFYVVVAAALLWLMFAKLAIRSFQSNRNVFTVVSLLFIASTSVLFASFASNATNPADMSPLGSSARYYVLPYALLFLSVLVLSHGNKKATGLGVILIILICRGSFIRLPDYQPLEWNAFSRLAEARPGTVIPINPSWPVYPGWFVTLPAHSDARSASSAHSLGFSPDAEVDNAAYRFTRGQQCANSSYLGLIAGIEQEKPGWLTLKWGQKGMRRFYPAGRQTAEFALESGNADEAWTLLFDQQRGNARLESLKIVCLDANPGSP